MKCDFGSGTSEINRHSICVGDSIPNTLNQIGARNGNFVACQSLLACGQKYVNAADAQQAG